MNANNPPAKLQKNVKIRGEVTDVILDVQVHTYLEMTDAKVSSFVGISSQSAFMFKLYCKCCNFLEICNSGSLWDGTRCVGMWKWNQGSSDNFGAPGQNFQLGQQPPPPNVQRQWY